MFRSIQNKLSIKLERSTVVSRPSLCIGGQCASQRIVLVGADLAEHDGKGNSLCIIAPDWAGHNARRCMRLHYLAETSLNRYLY